jgi:hypothetical protein
MSGPGIDYEVGGEIIWNDGGDVYHVVCLYGGIIECKDSFARIEFTRAYVDSAILHGDATYRSPAIASAIQAGARIPTPAFYGDYSFGLGAPAPKLAALPTLNVECLCCGNAVVETTLSRLPSSAIAFFATCCGKREYREWSEAQLERIVTEGKGRWTAFLSN